MRCLLIGCFAFALTTPCRVKDQVGGSRLHSSSRAVWLLVSQEHPVTTLGSLLVKRTAMNAIENLEEMDDVSIGVAIKYKSALS